jgi:hypothetical protein
MYEGFFKHFDAKSRVIFNMPLRVGSGRVFIIPVAEATSLTNANKGRGRGRING